MNFKKLLTLSLSLLLLVGCDNQCKHVDKDKDHICDLCECVLSECKDENADHYCDYCGKQVSPIPEEEEEKEEEEDFEPPFEGGIVDDGVHSGYEFTKHNVNRPTSGTAKVEIFGINDFHGAVNDNYVDDYIVEAGLKRVGTFAKEQTSKPNTLFIDQGDTWQGSLESNYNHGQIIQDVFSYAGMSLRTLGNHDFDWGIDSLKEIQGRKYEDYSIPTLASNVYDFDWETKKNGTTQQSDLGQEYATFTVENGLKIGFVGVIDNFCITSISTQFVESISFADPETKIKEISDYLRITKNCDIIVASMHADQELARYMYNVSGVTNKRYVDLFLNGHTHENEHLIRDDGVMMSQWGCNGECLGSVSLPYDFDNNKVIDSVEEDRTSYNARYLEVFYSNIDSKINGLVDSYLGSIKQIKEMVLSSNFSGEWSYIEELPNLMAEAVFYEAKNEGYLVDLSLVNRGRDSFDESVMTYSNLFKCFPFDNEVIIFNTWGQKALYTFSSNNSYHDNEFLSFDSTSHYLVAGLDYITFHVGPTREYNYFSDIEVVGKLEKDGKVLTYRDILVNYLLANPTKIFDSANYKYSDWHFSAW